MGDLNATYNRVVWVDIPVSDLERALQFYGNVLQCKIYRQESEGTPYCVLGSAGGNSGRLVPAESEIAPASGILVYFNVNGRIRDAVVQAEKYGGKILQRIHTIEPFGFRVVLLDSEGNRIALHSTVDA